MKENVIYYQNPCNVFLRKNLKICCVEWISSVHCKHRKKHTFFYTVDMLEYEKTSEVCSLKY